MAADRVDGIDVLAVMDFHLANMTLARQIPRREELREVRDVVAGLIEAGKALSFAAQTTGGTAGRDDGLVAAIEHFTAALARVQGGAA